LNSSRSELSFAVLPAPLETPLEKVCEGSRSFRRCPYELWVVLDLDDVRWSTYSMFTLRLSWPAFVPTEFDIALYTPAQLYIHLQDSEPPESKDSRTRVRYGRIRLVDAGVRNPAHPSFGMAPDPVPFVLKLEQLYFGVLPPTVVPTLLLLVPVTAVAAFVLLPRINLTLQHFAAQARNEIGFKKTE